jgi:hypothetical protein
MINRILYSHLQQSTVKTTFMVELLRWSVMPHKDPSGIMLRLFSYYDGYGGALALEVSTIIHFFHQFKFFFVRSCFTSRNIFKMGTIVDHHQKI